MTAHTLSSTSNPTKGLFAVIDRAYSFWKLDYTVQVFTALVPLSVYHFAGRGT